MEQSTANNIYFVSVKEYEDCPSEELESGAPLAGRFVSGDQRVTSNLERISGKTLYHR